MNPGYVYVLLCYALIGISYPIAKDAMTQVPIWIFTAITFAVSFAMLYPVVRILDKIILSKIGLRAWIAISAQSLLGAVLYTVFLCMDSLLPRPSLRPFSAVWRPQQC